MPTFKVTLKKTIVFAATVEVEAEHEEEIWLEHDPHRIAEKAFEWDHYEDDVVVTNVLVA